MFKNLHFKQKIYLIFFVFVLFFISFEIIIRYQTHTATIEEELINNATEKLKDREKVFQNFINNSSFILNSLRKDVHFKRYLKNKEYLEDFEEHLHSIVEMEDSFLQLRYLDKNGQEIARVDRLRDTKEIKTISKKNLQNKENRYYFKESKNRPLEKVWFSALDLNIENEKIEIPYNPTLRAIYPIENDGKFDGILIINYQMEDFLKKLTYSFSYKTILFDQDGYIIKSYDEKKDWGAYKDEKYNIKDEFPKNTKELLSKELVTNKLFVSKKLDLPLENEIHIAFIIENNSLKEGIEKKFYSDLIRFIFITILYSFLIYFIAKGITEIVKEIEQEKEKFSNIFYNNYAITILVNPTDFSIVDANQSALDFYGYTKEEFTKLKISDFNVGDLNEDENIVKILQRDGKASFRLNHKIRNGTIKIIDVKATFIFDGKERRTIAIINDETQKILQERELQKLNHRLNQAQEMANLGYWGYDIKEDKLWWSNQTYKIFNLQQDENIKLDLQMFLSYVHPDDVINVNEAYSNSLIDKLPYKIEHRILLKDGSIKYVLENAKHELDENGNIIKSLGTVMDITEQKIREKQLEESNNKLTIFINSNPIPTILLDVEGNVVRQNQSFINLFGDSTKALSFVEEWFLNSHPYKKYREYDKTKWDILVEQVSLNNGHIEPTIYKIRCIDYSLKDMIVSGTLYSNGLIVTLQDVSFIQQQKEEIKELNKNLKIKIKEQTKSLEAALEELNISQKLSKSASISLDLITNQISYYSAGFLDLFELDDKDTMDLDKYIKNVHPKDKEEFINKYFESLENKEPIFEMTYRLLLGDGRLKWIYDKSINVFDEDGKPLFTRCALQDVTEKYLQDIKLSNLNKNLERRVIEKTEKIYEEKERYQNLMKLASDGIFIMSSENGKLINYNVVAANLLGYDDEQMQELTVFDWDKKLKSIEEYHDIISNVDFTPIELQRIHTRKDGSNYVAQINAVRIKNSQNEFIYSSVRDITEQIKQEKELKKMNQELVNASEAKSQFLANMSHEIRTPLNGIMGLVDFMIEENPTDIQKEYLQIIQNSSKNLKNIINDILDYSKIQAGKFEIINKPFSLKTLLNNTGELFRTSIEQKALQYELKVENIQHNFLIGDALRINQVLSNILSNALKFTKKGSVKLRVYQTKSTLENITTIFEVEDTGVGISEEFGNKLFEEFTQGNESNTKELKGTGLGLTISKSLIELMGGSISYKSKEGVGTQFTIKIKLPYSDILQENMINTKNYRLKEKKNALLVEDNEVNQLISKKILNDLGFEIDIVVNGKEGVEKTKNSLYDIIFMDIQMPIMDGYEATKKIREFNKDIPIIALSAAVMEEETQKAINSGMNNHLSKPIEKDILIGVLNQFFTFETIEKSSSITLSEEKIMDIEKLSNKLELDKSSLVIFYETFLRSYENGLSILDENTNSDELKTYLHKLKGSCGELELTLLFKRIKKLDTNKKIDKNDILEIKEILQKTIYQINDFIVSNNKNIDENEPLSLPELNELLQKEKRKIEQNRFLNSEDIVLLCENLIYNGVSVELVTKFKMYAFDMNFEKALEVLEKIVSKR